MAGGVVFQVTSTDFGKLNKHGSQSKFFKTEAWKNALKFKGNWIGAVTLSRKCHFALKNMAKHAIFHKKRINASKKFL